MSFVDTVLPRRGRPPKAAPPHLTLVQAALKQPLPHGLAEANERTQRALAASNDASALRSEHDDKAAGNQARLGELKRRVNDAEVAFQLAEMRRRTLAPHMLTDEDLNAPTAEAVKQLHDELDREIEMLSRKDDLKASFEGEVTRRREAASTAALDLSAVLNPWGEQVVKAAEEQLALAATLADEAYAAVVAVQPWRRRHKVVVPKVIADGSHSSDLKTELPMPAAAQLAVGLIIRAP